MAELSIDDPKVDYLHADMETHRARPLVQLMGHPKLLSLHSLEILQQYIERMGIRRFETLASAAMLIRDGEITKRE